MKRRTLAVWHCDLKPVRVLLYLASFTWAALLSLPGPALDSPQYSVMLQIAPDTIWLAAFLIHGMCGVLRLAGPTRYPAWAVTIVNAFGSMIWCVSSFSILLSAYPPVGAAVGSVVLSFAAFWVFVRTPFGWIED